MELKTMKYVYQDILFFRKDRKDTNKKIGGGVLLYVKNDIVATEVSDSDDHNCEMLWIKLSNLDDYSKSKDCTYVGICYRSPSSPKDEEKALFENIRKYSQNNLI